MEAWMIVAAVVVFLLRRLIFRTLIGIVTAVAGLAVAGFMAYQYLLGMLDRLP